jgi:hypothetical protein
VKKAIVFIMVTIFLVSVMSSITSARSLPAPYIEAEAFPSLAQVNADILTFEGLLKAYSVNENPIVEEQVFLASNALSTSLEALNKELTELYYNSSEEQKLALEDAYLFLGSNLEKLAAEANQVFLEEDGKEKAQFGFQVDKDESRPNKFGGYWIGFMLGD